MKIGKSDPIDSPPEIGEPRLEKRESSGSFYHVDLMDTALEEGDPPACGRRFGNRSLTVQWVDDEWKLVGLIEDDANGINPVRFVNDLDGQIARPMEQCTSPKYWEWNVPHWAVFWDRLHGAPLDSWGCVNRRKCDRSPSCLTTHDGQERTASRSSCLRCQAMGDHRLVVASEIFVQESLDPLE